MNFRVLGLFLVFPLWAAFAGGRPERQSAPMPPSIEEPDASPESAERRGETVMRALAGAYPDRVEKIEYYNGDWTILVYGQRFYFAGGRLLPESLRDDMGNYTPLPFYFYEKDLPPWVPPTEEESMRMREQYSQRNTQRSMRSMHFYDTIWRASSRDEAWEHIKQIRFLGIPVQVHYSILVSLSLVEQRILRIANTNPAVRQWINNISTVEGWSWRNIASSGSRSFHAYGAAIDILPKSLGGLETYWLWTSQHNSDWWAVPYSRRFHPPDEVVKAFESFGFIWGGKWRLYDTMHFEYRPEVLVLNGIELMDLRNLR